MAATNERMKWGSSPPYLGLAEALKLAQQIYEQAAGTASYDVFSRIAGNSTSSSSFTKKLAALKGFGLVKEDTKGRIELSDIGLAIAAPLSPDATAISKKEAFLRQRVFAQVFDRHKGKLLPADEFLKNIIEQEFKIPRELSDAWVAAFKDAARVAGLLHDREDGKTQILDSPLVPNAPRPVPTRVETPPPSVNAAAVSSVVDTATSGHTSRIEVSGRRIAIFSIPDHLSARDAKKLQSAIQGLSSIIDSMVSEEPSEAQ